jgi:hypothetical protein
MNLRGGRLSACKTAKPDIKARAKNTPAADGGRYKESTAPSQHTNPKIHYSFRTYFATIFLEPPCTHRLTEAYPA